MAPCWSSGAAGQIGSGRTSWPPLPTSTRCWSVFRATGQSRALGEALLDQTLVAGIGNMWKAEALFVAGLKPWVPLREVDDERLRSVLAAAANLMQAPRRRRGHYVYRRAGRPCGRCGSLIRSWPQGDDARMAYWCPACQEGTEPRGA